MRRPPAIFSRRSSRKPKPSPKATEFDLTHKAKKPSAGLAEGFFLEHKQGDETGKQIRYNKLRKLKKG
jgi:hypothetical protein